MPGPAGSFDLKMAKITNRYFQFVGSGKNAQRPAEPWYPAADIYQTSDGWVVKVELAGVSAEDIQIEVHGNILYIAGCRKDRSFAVGMTYQQMEITYSRFEKTLKFPAVIEGVQLDHMFENGLLIIRLRKAQS